jgi:uncharacterized protein (UPF0332 family)
MNLKDLLNDNLIEPFTGTASEIKQKIELARADIQTSKESVKGSSRSVEWAYDQAYNAMLQSGTALMYSMGYRVTKKSGQHHWATEQFLKSECSKIIPSDALIAFGDARNKRHTSVYDQTGTISKSQADYLIIQAEIFVDSIAQKLKL